MRNLSAGVLLLLKEGLRELSPLNSDAALIKQKIQPTFQADGSVFLHNVERMTRVA